MAHNSATKGTTESASNDAIATLTQDRGKHNNRQTVACISQLQEAIFDPLSCIRGYAETLLRVERDLDADERKEFLQEIVDASIRLERVLRSGIELIQKQAKQR